jgi:hypothetical protein
MSVTKGIEFKVSVDVKEANKQIQEIQKRLQEMQKNQSYQDRAKAVGGAGGDKRYDEKIQKVFEQHQNRLLAMNKEDLAIAQKNFDFKQKLIERTEALIRSEHSSMKLKEQAQRTLIQLKEKELELGEEIQDRQATQNRATANLGGAAGGGGAGDGGPAGRLAQVGSMLKNAVPYIAAAAGVAKFLGEQTRFQQNKAGEQASIAQGMFKASGSDLLMSGQGAEFAVYQKERARGMENARIAQSGMVAREAGGTVLGGIVGAGLGGAVGGIGGFLGGNIPGAILGAKGGAAFGGAAGAAMGSVRNGGQLVGGITSFIQGETFEAGVQRARDLEYARDAARNVDVERARDPFKEKAMESMISKNDARQSIMRRSGLSYRQLVGGGEIAPGIGTIDMQGNFTPGAPGQGAQEGVLGGGQYTEQKTMSVMEQIAAAGGTSAQIGSPRGAQDLQRYYGVESAPQILGALSGKLIGGQKSFGPNDEVTTRMLAAAFSKGIDTSKMGAETEKFLQASTKFVMESGAKTEGGMAAVAGGLAQFMPEGSMAGIDVAVSAKERYEQLSGAGGPAYQQNLKLASLRQKFPGMNENELLYISRLSSDEIAAGDDPVLQRVMEKNKVSHEEMITGHRESVDKSLTFTQGTEQKLTKLRELENFKNNAPFGMEKAYDKDIQNLKSDLELETRGVISGGAKGYKATQVFSGEGKELSGIEAPTKALGMENLIEITNAKADQIKLEREGKYQSGAAEDFGEYLKKSNKALIEFAENLEKINAQANNPNPNKVGITEFFTGDFGDVLGKLIKSN